MVDAVFQDYFRFSHMEELRKDQAYLSICGGAAPSEKVCRDTQALLPQDAADFDDSVITVFGSQERSNVGYNPDVAFQRIIEHIQMALTQFRNQYGTS